MYPKCFNGTVGCSKDFEYHIDTIIKPIIYAPRKIPIELKEKLKKNIKK